jgi:hypothetical protein
MHGPNAVGKSSFINDVIKLYNTDSEASANKLEFFDVAVDCVEYYSEKLIAIVISHTLNNKIITRAKKIMSIKSPKGKLTLKGVTIPKNKLKSFGFKLCQNFDDLKKGINQYNELITKFRNWFAAAKITADNDAVIKKGKDAEKAATTAIEKAKQDTEMKEDRDNEELADQIPQPTEEELREKQRELEWNLK